MPPLSSRCSTVRKPAALERSHELAGRREVGDAAGQVAVGGGVGEQSTDARARRARSTTPWPHRTSPLCGVPTSSSAMRPPGRTTRASSTKKVVEVDEVAQGESARDAVDRGVRDGQAEDVGLDPRRAAVVGAQHPQAEVDRDGTVAGPGEVDAQVARAAGQVEHPAARRQAELPNGAPSPAHVEAERHDPVDQVVARRDGVEHLAHGGPLLVALRQRVAVPARRRRHRGPRLRRVTLHRSAMTVGGPGAVRVGGERAVLDERRQPVADLGRDVGELQRGRVDVPRPRRVDARIVADDPADRDAAPPRPSSSWRACSTSAGVASAIL